MDEILANAYIKGASDLLSGKIEGMPKVLPIPDNATNGDMLLELLKGQHDKIYPVGETQMGITLDCEWWNAPYNREVK